MHINAFDMMIAHQQDNNNNCNKRLFQIPDFVSYLMECTIVGRKTRSLIY